MGDTVNVKSWHIIVFVLLLVSCFLLVWKGTRSDSQLGSRDTSPLFHKTVPISFKRRKDIPNSCFPLTEQISGCLPSFILLGPSKAELEIPKTILESHPSINGANKEEYHSNPSELSFHSYFESFSYEQGKMFLYYDASAFYFTSSEAPMSIRSIAPTTLFLLPLMDPVERVISQYYSHTASLPKSCFSVPLEEYLQHEIDTLTSCNVLPVEFSSVPWKTSGIPDECKILSSQCSAFHYDIATEAISLDTHGAFLTEGLYIYHLHHWFSYFDRKQFHVTTIDEMPKSLTTLWKFVGVDNNLWLEEFLDESSLTFTNYESAVDKNTLQWLRKFYKPSLQALQKLYPDLSF